jgi:hypothetical protein
LYAEKAIVTGDIVRYSIRRNTETLLRVVFPHGLVLLHCIFLITRVFKKKYRSRKSTTKTRFIPLEADGNDRCRLRSGIAVCKKCTEAADACLLFALHHADRSKKILRDGLSRRLFRPAASVHFLHTAIPDRRRQRSFPSASNGMNLVFVVDLRDLYFFLKTRVIRNMQCNNTNPCGNTTRSRVSVFLRIEYRTISPVTMAFSAYNAKRILNHNESLL